MAEIMFLEAVGVFFTPRQVKTAKSLSEGEKVLDVVKSNPLLVAQ